jgi:putative ABC transport system substrate-binding protein
MRRREFIAVLGGAAAWPIAARAQQPDRTPLVGVLLAAPESDEASQSLLAAFRAALGRLDWREGSNLRVELRWGGGDASKLALLAKELVELQPDAIFGVTTSAIVALTRETKAIPIVFAVVADPIGSGFAASVARPGGNITGVTFVESAMGGKWVELLKEIAPRTEHIALLFNPATSAPLQFYFSSIQSAASSFAIETSVTPIHTKDEIEGVIAAQAHKAGGLIVMPDPFNAANRDLIVSSAVRFSVPTIYYARLYAESGGLIAYGDDRAEEYRKAAGYIDRILKGTKPADLPIQLPTKFELVINLKTAKTLGFVVPPSLLARADEVIE